NVGGVCAALLVAVNPLFLERSIGADNDVWNVVLPLCLMWAAMRAVDARDFVRQILFAIVGLVVAGLHALTWKGSLFTYVVVLLGLFSHLLLALLRAVKAGSDGAAARDGLRRAGVTLACFAVPALVAGVVRGSQVNVLTMFRPVGELFVPSTPLTGA